MDNHSPRDVAEGVTPSEDATRSWHPGDGESPRGAAGAADSGGFTPRAAIARHAARPGAAGVRSAIRSRLGELPVVYLLLLGLSISWRVLIGREDWMLLEVDLALIASLVAFMAVLWSRWPLSSTWLKGIELGMVGMIAARNVFVQFHMMLGYSLLRDRMMAQLTMKNVVLLDAVLILTYGLYVPKGWRRAAAIVFPLALIPFATLLVLVLRYPEPMGWLWLGWSGSTTPRLYLFAFDATVLLILAVGATLGALMVGRLRREVDEARQLGQYRLEGKIGSGGMGEVYLAEHALLKRPCAVKLIRPREAADPDALERFEHEVRITATLSHPNTVEIYDYGRTEDGLYYYVMEYLPGLNLAELVRRHGPLPPARAAHLLRQVCGAVQEAHEAGLIHRDIKPSNIVASRRGGVCDVAKLLDFGLVRSSPSHRAGAAGGAARVFGTPLFMSPEQAVGAPELDPRSDIYSLGAVAYFLLTGRPPFQGDRGLTVMLAHAREPVTPPSQLVAGLPTDLERVVLRCMAKDREDRYRDADSLERALAACACADGWDHRVAALWWAEVDRRDAGASSPLRPPPRPPASPDRTGPPPAPPSAAAGPSPDRPAVRRPAVPGASSFRRNRGPDG
ncbi:Serine/threonine-protein kinase PknB [Aquisphaera giovannonii]|uniref:non-specific serine/threonine protein kinase n=1 Tax=Aquisphaera giovannonii TaxID=406548 RepID=A0A5B9VWF5_9BACT|nr:serine/threonine-protein kinase [Aquisphaera giovannonii]QEH32394.1 Serine/threonine-protein kinase PknB [Aquisphaera giovannonii]